MMGGQSIDAKLAALLESAAAYAEKEPIYSLLLCRQAAESFLMKKHLKMVDEGDAKPILTLGDAFNNKLGLNILLDDLEKMSIQYIQNATNPFLHFRVDSLELRKDLVPRVLQEVHALVGEIDSGFTEIKPKIDGLEIKPIEKTQKMKDWRAVLIEELDSFEWPISLKGTVLDEGWLKWKLVATQRFLDEDKISELEKLRQHHESYLTHRLANLGLEISGSKDELIERLAKNKQTGIRYQHANEQIKALQEIISLTEEQRYLMLKKSTEAGLIALYNESGKRKKNKDRDISEKMYVEFLTGSKSVLPLGFPSTKKIYAKEKWEFIIIPAPGNKKKGRPTGKLMHEWKFLKL